LMNIAASGFLFYQTKAAHQFFSVPRC